MYLEERVEQLETLAIDQSKQSETIAKAVAKLTVDTQQGINELRQGQAKLQQGQDELRQEITELKVGQELILQILREKLS